MENAEPNRLGPTLSSFSELLPQLARLGPCPSPSTVQSLGDALHKRLQQPDNADTVAAVLMCKTSLKHCVLPLPPGRSLSSFDPEKTSFVLQVFNTILPIPTALQRSHKFKVETGNCLHLHAGLQPLSCHRQ
jgi:hypothetical protein